MVCEDCWWCRSWMCLKSWIWWFVSGKCCLVRWSGCGRRCARGFWKSCLRIKSWRGRLRSRWIGRFWIFWIIWLLLSILWIWKWLSWSCMMGILKVLMSLLFLCVWFFVTRTCITRWAILAAFASARRSFCKFLRRNLLNCNMKIEENRRMMVIFCIVVLIY